MLILDEWLDNQLMLNIAQENHLLETSFAKKIDHYHYEIRWFSPVKEVQFCEYGTLATSFIIFTKYPDLTEISFMWLTWVIFILKNYRMALFQ